MSRKRLSFDNGWKFMLEAGEGAQAVGYDDSGWRSLDLPHDWSIEGPFDGDCESGQSLAYLPGGIGWYRKHFSIPADEAGRRVFLDFDGAFRFTDVWVNGEHMGFFHDGYIGFGYDITDYVNFGGENLVAVRVDNSQQPNSRWYTGSGIYRHVWLTTTAQAYIVKDSAYITTPRVEEESAVYILTHVANQFDKAKAFSLVVEMLDAEGRVVASHWDGRIADPGTSARFENTLWVNNPVLWDTENPYLYTARFLLYDGEEADEAKLIDRMDIPFGVRTIEFHKDNGFLLNGKRVKIKGVALHHEAGLLGAAVPDMVWERRLRLLREAGVNGIRPAHAPMSPEFMDICDRMGFLVMDEVFDEWRLPWEKNYSKTRSGIGKALDVRYGSSQYFDEVGYENMATIIRRDRNHPCVVMWGIGNEIFEQNENFGYIIARKLVEVCHTEDPTRPAMSACERINSDIPGYAAKKEFLEALDVIGYNYVNRWKTTYRRFYAEDKALHPEWKVIGAENTNLGGVRGKYRFEGDSSNRATPLYFMNLLEIEERWKFTNLYDYVAGDFLWTGIDYLGEAAWPRIGSNAGMFDTSCFEKDGYYFFASQWSNKPIVKLAPHWNWEGHEGKAIPVVCYTNCDEVELFVNGQSYGVQAYDYFREGRSKDYGHFEKPIRRVTTQDLHLLWMIPYAAGEIRAVGTKDGVVYEDIVTTCGSAAKLTLEADNKALRANGTDICHVTVRLYDAKGSFAVTSGAKLNFELEGAGRILCLNAGDNESHEIGMYASEMHASSGMCLAYVQAGREAGEIRLTVSGEGIEPASVVVSVE